jgi:hypothetical protein
MLRTHRQRVPAMLVVACVGMMAYAVAGAAPDDGRELAPAEATAPAAKSDKATSTTEKGDKSSSTDKDACGGSKTPTTDKDGKDDPKDDKGSTPTTSKDGKDDPKDDSDSTSKTTVKKDVSTAAAVKGDSTTAATDKGDSDSSNKDDCKTTSTTRKPTDKNDDDKTTDTTRKDGKTTTTTTDGGDRPTTPSTDQPDTVEPSSPSGDPGSGGGDSGGSTDQGATPIEPQEAPPEASDSGAPVDDPQWADDPGAADDGGWYDVPDEGPIDFGNDEVAIAPMASPGAPEPVLPTFGLSGGTSDVGANRPSRSSGRTQEWAAPPRGMSSSGYVQASPGVTESQAVSRNLAGLQTSVTESAFPASIISTPKIFPINRRDPLAAAALVLLVGVSRELFKVWRRRASDFWPA